MKSIKREIIILAIVIVALLGYLFISKKDNVHYKIPELEQLNKEQIDKIEIIKGGSAPQTIRLEKKGVQWVIVPQGYVTDGDKVPKMVEIISQLKLTDLASEAKAYAIYDLDKDKAVHVIAYSKGKVVRDFQVGKVASTYGHTFVTVNGDYKIYYARESFRDQFDIKTDDLRNKMIMKVNSNEVSEIEVEKDGSKMLISKKAASAPAAVAAPAPANLPNPGTPGNIDWVMANGQKASKTNVDSLVAQFNDLSCHEYIEGKTKDDFKAQMPVYSIRLKGNKDYTLTIFPKLETPAPVEVNKENPGAPGEAKYPAISSESPYPFILPAFKVDQIMKKPEDLMNKPQTEKAENKPGKK